MLNILNIIHIVYQHNSYNNTIVMEQYINNYNNTIKYFIYKKEYKFEHKFEYQFK